MSGDQKKDFAKIPESYMERDKIKVFCNNSLITLQYKKNTQIDPLIIIS